MCALALCKLFRIDHRPHLSLVIASCVESSVGNSVPAVLVVPPRYERRCRVRCRHTAAATTMTRAVSAVRGRLRNAVADNSGQSPGRSNAPRRHRRRQLVELVRQRKSLLGINNRETALTNWLRPLAAALPFAVRLLLRPRFPSERSHHQSLLIQRPEVLCDLACQPCASDRQADFNVSLVSGLRKIGGGNEDICGVHDNAFRMER